MATQQPQDTSPMPGAPAGITADSAAARGDAATREFYDEVGWKEVDGGASTVDYQLFGDKEQGPIRVGLHQLHLERQRAAIRKAGDRPRVVECGCGGNPDVVLCEMASHYTGVDFSERGLKVSEKTLIKRGVPHTLVRQDISKLPFADGEFDVAFSAHALYHMSEPAAQAAAIREMVRVVRPGGMVLLILANPRPLLFPARLAKRVIADTPVLSHIANKLRPPPPLPYKPMTIGWTKRQFRGAGQLDIVGFAIPSTAFSQKVSEFGKLGSVLWRGVRFFDTKMPRASARLGNYLMYALHKSG